MREDVGDRRAEGQAARASIYISENSTDKIRFHFQLGRLRSRFGDLCHPQSSPARPPSPSSDRLGCTLEGREYSPIGMKAERMAIFHQGDRMLESFPTTKRGRLAQIFTENGCGDCLLPRGRRALA